MINIQQRPRRAVYTALIGNYDNLSPITFSSKLDFFLFTDDVSLEVLGWKKIQIQDLNWLPERASWKINRFLKLHPHICLPNYDQTLYIDSNIELLVDPEILFDKYLGDSDLSVALHTERCSVDDEFNACYKSGKIGMSDYDRIQARMNFYKSTGFNIGPLTENNVLFRNNCILVNKAMELWWDEIEQGVVRDQISLPYVLMASNLMFSPFNDGPRKSAKYMTIKPHWPSGKPKNLRYLLRWISALRRRSILHIIAARAIDAMVYLASMFRVKY